MEFFIGVPLPVDTFLLISGALLVYNFLVTMNKGTKFNIFKFYLHRYLRLTPAIVAMIVLHLTFLRYLGSGPYWPQIYERFTAPCRSHWWSTLLYVQNYVNDESMCIEQSWFLAIDMQLFLVSPLILYPLIKWPRQTLIGIAVLLLSNTILIAIVAWSHKLSAITGINVFNFNMRSFMKYYYNPTHTRAQAWIVGLLLGYALYNTKNERPIIKNKFVASLLTVSSIVIVCACIATGHELVMEQYDRLLHTLYITFIRLVWTSSIAWLILACASGIGGPLNAFFSHPIWQFVSKLNYCLFIVHMTVIVLVRANKRAPEYFLMSDIWYDFWGCYMFSLFVAFFWSLLFESPVIALEKMIFNTKQQ